MTYFGFLLRFLVIPIVVLLAVYLWERRKGSPEGEKSSWVAIGVHIALALLYTTPWDNYLVATGVWYYNPALVTGILLGYVPVEEYTFFILETLFVGLWWKFLYRRVSARRQFQGSIAMRVWSSAVLLVLWVLSLIVFFSEWKPGTYLSITLLWALPPVILQSTFGADILWHHRKLVAATVFPMGLYLSFVDSLAITATTWTISPGKSTGWLIGSLPVEEGVFFFITVILVTFGVTLMNAAESRQRLLRIPPWWAAAREKLL